MRQPFLLVKRDLNGKKHWYAKIWNDENRKYFWKSVGSIKDDLGTLGKGIPHTSKAGATALVRTWIIEKPSLEKDDTTLLGYLLPFWELDSEYIRSKKSRGQSISVNYIKGNKSAIANRLKPFLESTKAEGILLDKVTPGMLESFVNYLSDQTPPLSSRRINQLLQAVKVPISEAARLGMIKSDPGKTVLKLQEEKPTREILSPSEVKAYFDIPQEDKRFYGINLLSATTGLRLGECRGLLSEDIKDGYIDLKHNWQDSEGLKAPKWGSQRLVPLPAVTAAALKDLVVDNPYGNQFVFWGIDPDHPLGKWHIEKNFKDTFCAVEGMTETIRKFRHITFHAWRHFYNSMLRGNLPDHALRKLTGHSSEAMTERYTTVTEDQRKAVSELADKIFKEN